MNFRHCRDAGMAVVVLLLTSACAREEAPAVTTADGGLDRTVLPIHEPAVTAITEMDARKAKAPPRFEVKAPEGAPNVVIVLIDDIGFGARQRVRRADPHADAGEAGRRRAALQPLPHDGALQPDARRAAHGPQPPREQRGRDHGAGHGVSRATRASVRRA